jgi:RNA polymerase sigma-70 factor, ECF subfamily
MITPLSYPPVVASFTYRHSLMSPQTTATANSALINLDDNALVAELNRGHHEAFTVLFERYSDTVFRIARRKLGDHGEAEETTQQVFLEAYERIAQFDAQKGHFKSWLLRKASRRAIDRKRSLKSQGIYAWTEIDEETTAEHSPAEGILQLSRQEIRHLVKELLRALSPRQRQVISLSFFRDLTLQEVQGETKETLPTIRHLYYGGLKKLRSALLDRDHKPTIDRRI